MTRTILSLALFTTLAATSALQAEPASIKKTKTKTSKPILKVDPAPPMKEGWSLVKGVWTHSDGYQFTKGQIVRVGTHTHKTPPKPPTKAEMEVALKKTPAVPKTPADAAAAKNAERQRNLVPRPAPQTGSHL